MLYSFDVFDTLITRQTATPRGIFALMQQELSRNLEFERLSGYLKNNFYYLRIHAENLARAHYQKNGIEDVALGQIYEALSTTGCVSSQDVMFLADLERQTEWENVIGIQENIDKVKSLLAAKERVVLISDMYLEERTIRNLLIKADSIFVNVPLYVSSEYKQGKYSGNLYKTVKEQEGCEYSTWIHCGDNPHSDIKAAEDLGISAVPFAYEDLKLIERAQLKINGADCFSQLCVGAARNVRMEGQLSGPAAIGCTVAGPILVPYVQWILEISGRQKIDRLYFIARDGFILKKIADIFIEKNKLPIKTYYIYGSRKVWRMPSYDGKQGSLRNLISLSYPERIKSLQMLAEVLQISYENLLAFLPKECQADQAELSYASLSAYIFALERDPGFRNFLYQVQQKNKKIVQKYLRQEINFSDNDFAFVDLGGTGFTQKCLADLLQDFYGEPIKTFFFKMDQINFSNHCIYYNFLPSKLKNDLVIEMICRAVHGQTDSYEEVNECVIPVLKQKEGAAIVAHGYQDYIDGIGDFASAFAAITAKHKLSVRVDLLLQYLEYIMEQPDEEILNFLADMPNSLTGREAVVHGFAPRLTKKEIRDIFLLYPIKSFERYYQGTDLSYARLRCSKTEQEKIEFYKTNRNLISVRFEKLFKKALIQPEDSGFTLRSFPYFIFGTRFVIYGAGKFGRRVYFSAKEKGSQLVAWIDKNYKNLIAQEMPVTGDMSLLDTISYDAIFIAVIDKKIAGEIKNDLISRGVQETKIIGLSECMAYLDLM